MEQYPMPKLKDVEYEVFNVNMIMDTKADAYLDNNLAACKNCQCNCRLCLGGKAPADAENISKINAEKVLEQLLLAA